MFKKQNGYKSLQDENRFADVDGMEMCTKDTGENTVPKSAHMSSSAV